MTTRQAIENTRQQRSACCEASIYVAYVSHSSARTAVVYGCVWCDRLTVLDSRDEKE